MLPDDPSKSVTNSGAGVQNQPGGVLPVPKPDDVVDLTNNSQIPNTPAQSNNVWGQTSNIKPVTQEAPPAPFGTLQNQNGWGQPPHQQEPTPSVTENNPNRNIWGQPIDVPEPAPATQDAQTTAVVNAPVVVGTAMEETPSQGVLNPLEEKPKTESLPPLNPPFNPYEIPPQTMENAPQTTESTTQATGNLVVPGTPTAESKNPLLETALPPEPKRGFPKIIILMVALIILVPLIIFGIKALLSARSAATNSAAKKTDIIWWGIWEEESVIKPLIAEYESKNPKVKINYVRNSEQDYRERLSNALAAGTGPDIFRFHNTWVPMFSKELDSIPMSVMSSSDFTKNYFPVIASDASKGTNFVGIPLGYDALTLFINEDIFSQESVDPPKTWVEMRDVAKKLTKVENGQIVRAGVALGRTENVDHWQDIIGLMLIQNRVTLAKPEGKKTEDALKFFSIFSSVDKVWDETLPPSTRAFASGQLAMYFGPSWRALTIKELNPNLKFKTFPLPQLPKEDPNEQDVSYANYWLDGVWEGGKNKDLAWDFLKFISSKESLEKMYQLQVNSRGVGVSYPRVDMKDMLTENTILGSVSSLAPNAKSWYLASRTFDGPTGINSQISKYFEDTINAINNGVNTTKAMESLTPGVVQVLQQYGLTK